MQNRYVGDVGDFGKLGMLRYIERAGIKVGINWYLTEDENHNKDGKHIGYMHDKKFEGIDDDLRNALSSLVNGNNRSVLLLENMKLLQADIYYHEIIKTMKGNVRGARSFWHQQGLESIKGSE